MLGILAVLVKIDKARGDHQPFGVQHARAHHRFGRDAGDLAIGNADIPRCVEPGLGVHDASVLDHDFVFLGKRRMREKQRQKQN